MNLTEYKKMNGEIIIIPKGFQLTIEETSNCVYGINLFDNRMCSVSNQGTDLDDMIEKAIDDLIKMNKSFK